MNDLQAYTKEYVSKNQRICKDFLSEMIRQQGKKLPFEKNFIGVLKESSENNFHIVLQDKYYYNLWAELCLLYKYTLLKQRFDKYLRTKSFSEIPKDFSWKKVEDNKMILNQIKKDFDLELNIMATLSYYLNNPDEVDQNMMEYLIVICDYDGSYGPKFFRMFYDLITCEDRPSVPKKRLSGSLSKNIDETT